MASKEVEKEIEDWCNHNRVRGGIILYNPGVKRNKKTGQRKMKRGRGR